jgi:hypothetical protein
MCNAECICPQTCDCCCRAALVAELSCSSASRVQFAKRLEAPTPKAEVELLHIVLHHNKHVLRPLLYLRTPLLLPGSACLLIPPALLTCRYSHLQALAVHRLRQEQPATSLRRVCGQICVSNSWAKLTGACAVLFKKDKGFRRYAAGVERALALWDAAQQEWADYISFLGRLLKVNTSSQMYLGGCAHVFLPSGSSITPRRNHGHPT